jgi:ankyrin repeat protein
MKRKILNELGDGGWGAIHYAVFCNKPNILNELLKKVVDVNKCTTDGWLPLQLAINRKNFDVLQILLCEQTIRVNETTSKGTALHVAAKLKYLEGMEALLKAGADWKYIDDKGKNCM